MQAEQSAEGYAVVYREIADRMGFYCEKDSEPENRPCLEILLW